MGSFFEYVLGLMPVWLAYFVGILGLLTAANFYRLRASELAKLDSDERGDAHRIRDSLAIGDAGTRYREMVRGVLRWTARALPNSAHQFDLDALTPKQARQVAFSNGSADFFLRIAVAYPFVLLVTQYALFGGSGMLGELGLLPDLATGARWLFYAGLSTGSLSIALGSGAFGFAWRPWQKTTLFWGGWCIIGLSAFAFAGAFAGAIAFAVWRIVDRVRALNRDIRHAGFKAMTL